jgi:RNA polymerase sigma-70 factor (ECF subfamily)
LDADKRIEPGGDPGPYRVTIAVNHARNHVRDARCRGEVLTSFDECEIRDECLTPEELLRRRQREKLARELIDQLEPKYRDLVIKHDLEDIPLAQIAAEQGLPLDTVKTRHRRALEELEVQGGRRRARQRSRGWDDSACVPVALGFGRRASWVASLRRFGMRILVQAALVLLTGALVSAVPPLPGLESWTRAAAVRAAATAPAERDAVAPPARGGAQSAAGPVGGDGAPEAAAPAAATAHEISSRTEHGSAHGEAMAIGTPAPSNAKTTSHRAAPPASAVRPTAGEVERSLVDQARRAIEANDVMADVEARRLLEAHARQFPRGRLAAEREALFRQLR